MCLLLCLTSAGAHQHVIVRHHSQQPTIPCATVQHQFLGLDTHRQVQLLMPVLAVSCQTLHCKSMLATGHKCLTSCRKGSESWADLAGGCLQGSNCWVTAPALRTRLQAAPLFLAGASSRPVGAGWCSSLHGTETVKLPIGAFFFPKVQGISSND